VPEIDERGAQRVWAGDAIEAALKAVGITEEGLDARLLAVGWVWGCGCKDRKARFNRLHRWAEASVKLGTRKARAALAGLLGLTGAGAGAGDKGAEEGQS
jgi:hypothetical protein